LIRCVLSSTVASATEEMPRFVWQTTIVRINAGRECSYERSVHGAIRFFSPKDRMR
jgi:hypothetical protein